MSRAKVRSINAEDAKRMMQSHHDIVSRASEKYRMFAAREPDKDIFLDINWPKEQVVLGVATGEGYRSDKWNNDRTTEDYIHRHSEPYPELIINRPSDEELYRNPSLGELVNQDSNDNFVEEPKEKVFFFMGFCLDIEFIRDGMMQKIDYTTGELPVLIGHPDIENLLVICPMDGSPCVLITSPILTVTPHGIEN